VSFSAIQMHVSFTLLILSVTRSCCKRLTSHDDKSVSRLARRVVSLWKNHFKEKLSKLSLDVRCDHATTESRETVRKHMSTALMTDHEHESLVCCVRSFSWYKVGFHYLSSRPELTKKCTGVHGPSTWPVNSGRELG